MIGQDMLLFFSSTPCISVLVHVFFVYLIIALWLSVGRLVFEISLSNSKNGSGEKVEE